jgi:hypothetical protein
MSNNCRHAHSDYREAYLQKLELGTNELVNRVGNMKQIIQLLTLLTLDIWQQWKDVVVGTAALQKHELVVHDYASAIQERNLMEKEEEASLRFYIWELKNAPDVIVEEVLFLLLLVVLLL